MIEPKCIFAPYPNGDTEDIERVHFRDFLMSKNGVMVLQSGILEGDGNEKDIISELKSS